MLILALESSAKAASVALCRDGRLLAMNFQNNALTHSRTLLPMLESMLDCTETSPAEIDCFAASHGPGSFTGLRIGLSALKGLAWAEGKPCCTVSTLEAAAQNMAHCDGMICAVMDARRNQVYNALFRAEKGRLERLCVDRAVSLEELKTELLALDGVKYLVGDGAELCHSALSDELPELVTAPPQLLFQNAWGVCLAAWPRVLAGELKSAHETQAEYIRLSQAERERLEKLQSNNT